MTSYTNDALDKLCKLPDLSTKRVPTSVAGQKISAESENARLQFTW